MDSPDPHCGKAPWTEGRGGLHRGEGRTGVFVVVELTLTNEKDEPATILEDNVRLLGGNGKEYTTDLDAALAFDNPLVIAEEIQPDLSKDVVAVYDVPKRAVKGAKLLVKDFWTDSTGEIDLGLK